MGSASIRIVVASSSVRWRGSTVELRCPKYHAENYSKRRVLDEVATTSSAGQPNYKRSIRYHCFKRVSSQPRPSTRLTHRNNKKLKQQSHPHGFQNGLQMNVGEIFHFRPEVRKISLLLECGRVGKIHNCIVEIALQWAEWEA